MYIHRRIEDRMMRVFGNHKVLILVGPRQVGKTTLVERLVLPKGGVIYNLDIELDLQRIEAAARLEPREAMQFLNAREILVIDEAPRYPDIGRVVKGWYDARVPVKIMLLGSSSLDLLNRSAEPLTGRNEKFVLTPLLFEEALAAQSWYRPDLLGDVLTTSFHNQIRVLQLQAMVFGGYPEVLSAPDKNRYLLNLVSDYLLKDLWQSELVKSMDVVKKLVTLLAYQVGSEASVSELAVNLGLTRQTVERYLELLERTWVIFRLRGWSRNPRKEIVKSSKIYFWDTGVRNGLLKAFDVTDLRPDIGSLWEQWVIAEIAKMNELVGDIADLHFWRTRDGSEVDLVISRGRQLKAFEIKWSTARMRPRKSFERRYGVPVETITRENFWEVFRSLTQWFES